MKTWNNYRWRLISIVMGLSLLGLVHPALALSQDVPLYGLHETSIDYQALSGQPQPYSDPFYGVDLEAVFVSPSGKTVTWWGFFDGNGAGGQGGNIWKLRFMPTEVGNWIFTWRFSDGSFSGSGFFKSVDNASNPRKPGPLKHDPNIHQWLVSADESRHVFLNMYTDWKASSTSPWTNPQGTIDKVKNNGFDVLSMWSTLYYSDPNFHIWLDKTDYVPRLPMWKTMENGLYQKAYEQEVYLYEWDGFYSGNGLYGLFSKPIAFQNKVIKYWLARTAPYYFFIYNIGFELSEFVSVPSWPVERATFVKNIDPWDHLITGHELRGFNYQNNAVIDFSATQIYNYPSYHSTALSIWNSPSQPHPHMSEGLWDAPWGRPNSETQSRIAQWDLLTGGGSYMFYFRDGFRGLTSAKHLHSFLGNGIKWWTLSPHDEVVVSGTAYVLAKIGVEYIAYSASGNSIRLNIPTGSYQSRWFNPAAGTYTNWSALEATNGTSNLFNKPNSNDWVLQIAQGLLDTTPPNPPANLF